ncbi:MAG TPA: Clp protease N-terminal domain-containing protein [Terriglobales bacterium]
MFERYTEKARRVIFFARYEASQFGTPYIETEHILLGLLREDKALRRRLLPNMNDEAIRRQIEAVTTKGEKVSTSVDLPLSHECKQVLTYAANEAELLANRNVGTEHLLLGLLREEKSLAARLLFEAGLRLAAVREALAYHEQEARAEIPGSPTPGEATTDLSHRAAEGMLRPFVEREKEMESLVLVLGRSTKNNAALVGEPGVGRRSLAEGLAQRMADGDVPSFLAERTMIELDTAQMLRGHPRPTAEFLKKASESLPQAQRALLFMEDLLSLLAGSGTSELATIIKPLLLNNKIQCISAATPLEWTKALETCNWLDRCFRPIDVEPMSEAAAVEVVMSAKDRYERFHGLTYTADALQYAVLYSSALIKDRHLPDKALDLIDEAAAYVHARSFRGPKEIVECRQRIRSLIHKMQNSIATHDFDKARHFSDLERREHRELRALLKKHNLEEAAAGQVKRSDIEEVLARWTGIPVSAIRERGSGPAQAEP